MSAWAGFAVLLAGSMIACGDIASAKEPAGLDELLRRYVSEENRATRKEIARQLAETADARTVASRLPAIAAEATREPPRSFESRGLLPGRARAPG